MEIKSESMNIHEKNQVVYLSFPHLESLPFIKHGFTTRIGGISEGIYESMNLNFSTGDKRENVLENYKIICKTLEIDYNNLVLSAQTHDIHIKCVEDGDRGKGILREKDYLEIDGLITNVANIPLVTLYADCVPVFFVDPVRKVVGLAHAGWKGTVKGIVEKMVGKFVDVYGSKKEEILVGIGPSIGSCCFEVEKDVAEEFEKIALFKEYVINKGTGKYMIDLWAINKAILIEAGIGAENIILTDICTKCNKDMLFSHRGHQGKRGGMAAIIQLKE